MRYRLEKNDTTITIAMEGKLTREDNISIVDLVRDVENHEFATLDIDLNDLTFIDSSGVGQLLSLQHACERNLAHMIVRNPQGQVKQTLQTSNFGEICSMRND